MSQKLKGEVVLDVARMIFLFLLILTFQPYSAHAAGSIVISKRSSGRISVFGVTNHSTLEAAKSSALRICSRSHSNDNCEVKGTFENRCFAVSLGDNRTSWGTGFGDHSDEAEEAANRRCEQFSNSRCAVESSGCDAVPTDKIFTYQMFGNAIGVTILGHIEPGDDQLFLKAVLPELRNGGYIYQVRIYSRGGNTDAAFKIGRMVRLLRASAVAPEVSNDTRVCSLNPFYAESGGEYSGSFGIRFSYESGEGDPTCTCMSACSIIWMGGVGRFGDVVGVHRMAWDAEYYRKFSLDEAQQMYDRAVRANQEYNREMGVPDWLEGFEMQFSSQQIQLLSADQLQQFRNYPPYLDQMIIAKCGSRERRGNRSERERHTDCRFQILEENGKVGAKNFLAKYGGSYP
ncbi:MAG TPA: DUF4189 domain-containing protein [Bradyrhizobium sp.]